MLKGGGDKEVYNIDPSLMALQSNWQARLNTPQMISEQCKNTYNQVCDSDCQAEWEFREMGY